MGKKSSGHKAMPSMGVKKMASGGAVQPSHKAMAQGTDANAAQHSVGGYSKGGKC